MTAFDTLASLPVGIDDPSIDGLTSSPPDHMGERTAPRPPRHAFAHASEAELARIFDFYAVRWEYEPHVFPIQWNLDGAVVESFTPDFFLPDFDLYVELTTLRQPLVRKKNRKLRRLRELYPEVRIKLFYARDFRALMLKYGKVALVGALSGTSGQVVPAGALALRPAATAADPATATAPVPATAAATASVLATAAALVPATDPPASRPATRRAPRARSRAIADVAPIAAPASTGAPTPAPAGPDGGAAR